MYTPLLDVEASFCVAGERDCAPCQKWAKREGFVACPKTMASVGHLKRICKDAFSVEGAVQETCSSELLGGQGADFLRGIAFWSIRSVGLLRWFCVTGAALRMTWHHFFVAGAVITLDRWSGKIAKCIGTRLSALHSTFHIWKKSRKIASLLMLSSSKIFQKWGSLSELLCFGCCQTQKLRKSRNSCVFQACRRQTETDRERETDRDRQRETETDRDRQRQTETDRQTDR